jgi:hypothetical protein
MSMLAKPMLKTAAFGLEEELDELGVVWVLHRSVGLVVRYWLNAKKAAVVSMASGSSDHRQSRGSTDVHYARDLFHFVSFV